jgi:hypothetical protein
MNFKLYTDGKLSFTEENKKDHDVLFSICEVYFIIGLTIKYFI